jgi:hypothetical protein
VTLREAIESGLLGGMTLATARNARHRDEAFPQPAKRSGKDMEYEIHDLVAYASGQKSEAE